MLYDLTINHTLFSVVIYSEKLITNQNKFLNKNNLILGILPSK